MKVPAIGSKIYVPTIGQYFIGGLGTVANIVGDEEDHQVIVKELSISCAWERWIGPIQEELKKEFGNQAAYDTGIPMPCPVRPKSD